METLQRHEAHPYDSWQHNGDALKFDFSDWGTEVPAAQQATQPMLSAESQSNQEELTSLPGEELDDSRKRLHEELHSESVGPVADHTSAPTRGPKRQNSANRRAGRQTRSPRSYDSGEDSRELRPGRSKSFLEVTKPDPATAAKNKASRERQRRERLNESFVELTKTLDPVKYVRAEKTTIIAETIKILKSMREENEQLRLEKRSIKEQMSQVEKEKDTLLFQQGLLQQELEAAHAAAFRNQTHGIQQHMGRMAPVVAVGVPVNQQEPRSGGLSQMIQRQHSLQRQNSSHGGVSLAAAPATSSQMSQQPPQPASDRGADLPMSEAFLSVSPPDFQDLDLGLQKELLSGTSPSAGLVSWLTQSDF